MEKNAKELGPNRLGSEIKNKKNSSKNLFFQLKSQLGPYDQIRSSFTVMIILRAIMKNYKWIFLHQENDFKLDIQKLTISKNTLFFPFSYYVKSSSREPFRMH